MLQDQALINNVNVTCHGCRDEKMSTSDIWIGNLATGFMHNCKIFFSYLFVVWIWMTGYQVCHYITWFREVLKLLVLRSRFICILRYFWEEDQSVGFCFCCGWQWFQDVSPTDPFLDVSPTDTLKETWVAFIFTAADEKNQGKKCLWIFASRR